MRTDSALAQLLDAPELAISPYRTYRTWEVALLVFRHSPDWFRKNRKALIAEGFPRPISNTFNAPWHGEDLLAWLRRDKSAPQVEGQHSAVVDITSRLAARARAIAGAKR